MPLFSTDVKPENLLMTHEGVIKLTDFGVAKILDNVERCRSTSGTHGYMPPEIYKGDHTHGTAAQWFSAGITLHEFVVGRRPFEAQRLQCFRQPNNRDTLGLDINRHKYGHEYPNRSEDDQASSTSSRDTLSRSIKDFLTGLLHFDVRTHIPVLYVMRGISHAMYFKLFYVIPQF